MKNLTKLLISLIAVALILLAPYKALAESFFKYGLGVLRSAETNIVETKAASLGFRDSLFGPFVYQYEGGLWIDSSGGGRRTSAFLDAGIGLEAVAGSFVVRSTHGIAFVSTPDAYLGGSFPNFNLDLHVGIRDRKGAAIGLSFKHISNAGLMSPNVGRDFVLIDLGVPW